MSNTETFEDKQKKANEEHLLQRQQHQFKNDLNDLNTRARSISVGTAFGGVCEISIRRIDGNIAWAQLQPVEVIELIHQLAANVGCAAIVQPRQDFASWRSWKHTDEELEHFRGNSGTSGVGWPPHAKHDGDPAQYKTALPAPELQPGLQPALMARSESNEQTVATQETVGRKRTKRAATAT